MFLCFHVSTEFSGLLLVYFTTLFLSENLYKVEWVGWFENKELGKICRERLRKSTKSLSRGSRCPSRISKRVPPEHKFRALSQHKPGRYFKMLKCYFVNIMKRAETVKKFNCVCLQEKKKRKMEEWSGDLGGWRLASWVWLYAAEMCRASKIWTAFSKPTFWPLLCYVLGFPPVYRPLSLSCLRQHVWAFQFDGPTDVSIGVLGQSCTNKGQHFTNRWK